MLPYDACILNFRLKAFALFDTADAAFIERRIQQCGGDPQKLFKVLESCVNICASAYPYGGGKFQEVLSSSSTFLGALLEAYPSETLFKDYLTFLKKWQIERDDLAGILERHFQNNVSEWLSAIESYWDRGLKMKAEELTEFAKKTFPDDEFVFEKSNFEHQLRLISECGIEATSQTYINMYDEFINRFRPNFGIDEFLALIKYMNELKLPSSPVVCQILRHVQETFPGHMFGRFAKICLSIEENLTAKNGTVNHEIKMLASREMTTLLMKGDAEYVDLFFHFLNRIASKISDVDWFQGSIDAKCSWLTKTAKWSTLKYRLGLNTLRSLCRLYHEHWDNRVNEYFSLVDRLFAEGLSDEESSEYFQPMILVVARNYHNYEIASAFFRTWRRLYESQKPGSPFKRELRESVLRDKSRFGYAISYLQFNENGIAAARNAFESMRSAVGFEYMIELERRQYPIDYQRIRQLQCKYLEWINDATISTNQQFILDRFIAWAEMEDDIDMVTNIMLLATENLAGEYFNKFFEKFSWTAREQKLYKKLDVSDLPSHVQPEEIVIS